MKKLILSISVAVSLIFGSIIYSSCTFLDNVATNVASIANLLNCEYSLNNVDNIAIAGVNLKNVSNGQISASDVVSLVSAITAKSVPLTMNVNINVKNPTDRSATLSRMDWALDVAETQAFATGATTKSYAINAGKTTSVPLGVSTDIFKVFSEGGINSLKTFASSFKEGKSDQLGLRIRPSIEVAGQTLKSPEYITVIKSASNS